ncbi:MAG TPA: hypothetical protein VHC91_11665 [Trinickia sp.]|uniref:hypothetical protein n=1 Tax=Trinickia sp. TaxID=2571163 RepID=UPI002CCA896A|nr:hypothetical protein [Trinickia sp.]HVW51034.1 hypothetical protein [Trinickia sp.]
MRSHPLFAACAACAAALFALYAPANVATESTTPTRYWYDGATKMPLYRQPQLDGRPKGPGARPDVTGSRRAMHAQAKRGGRAGEPSFTVYSTGPDPRSARLMTQGPGILFTVANEAMAQRTEAWLAARGLRAEPIAGGAVYKVESVRGEQALDLANALYESGFVKFAQPNWVLDLDPPSARDASTRIPPG